MPMLWPRSVKGALPRVLLARGVASAWGRPWSERAVSDRGVLAPPGGGFRECQVPLRTPGMGSCSQPS